MNIWLLTLLVCFSLVMLAVMFALFLKQINQKKATRLVQIVECIAVINFAWYIYRRTDWRTALVGTCAFWIFLKMCQHVVRWIRGGFN